MASCSLTVREWMKRTTTIILAVLLAGCGTRERGTMVDVSGTYVFDPASIAYPKLGVSYFPFIAPDTVPFSIIAVEQNEGNTLVIRYQANHEDGSTWEEKRYDLHDPRFRFEDEHLIFRVKVDRNDFAVVWGKEATTIRIHKSADGDLVFENKLTAKSLAIPMGFPIWKNTTWTGMVVLATAGTNASPVEQAEPEPTRGAPR